MNFKTSSLLAIPRLFVNGVDVIRKVKEIPASIATARTIRGARRRPPPPPPAARLERPLCRRPRAARAPRRSWVVGGVCNLHVQPRSRCTGVTQRSEPLRPSAPQDAGAV
ncbi:hypothetical protein EVAR_36927_1 [Eumeta japonica]|uniref:Uncharacterized protein n=1 Tax=Eumeta variegata TaxID=151549 RepID=A0A4C1X873_EUMVA|nr:hypothetical protein EVAR_36927_1 [Eumeta japonica]